MKTVLKKIIIILLIFIFLGISFFFIDYIRVKNQLEPIFCIRKVIYRDGGTKEYYGFGYKVISFNKILSDGSKFKKLVIGNWNISYNDYENEWKENELNFKDIELYNNLTGYMSSTNTDFKEGKEILKILESLEFNEEFDEELNKKLENNYTIEVSNEFITIYYIKSSGNYIEKEGKLAKISDENLKILIDYIDKLINTYQIKFKNNTK